MFASSYAYLFDGDHDDVAGNDLDDVDLQQPPDEKLQLVEVLEELEEQHRETVHHQVPFVLQVWSREHTLRFTHAHAHAHAHAYTHTHPHTHTRGTQERRYTD